MKLKPRGRRYLVKALLPGLEHDLNNLRSIYTYINGLPPETSWSQDYMIMVYMQHLRRYLGDYRQDQQRARYFIARLDARDPLCERLVDYVSIIEAEWEWFSLH